MRRAVVGAALAAALVTSALPASLASADAATPLPVVTAPFGFSPDGDGRYEAWALSTGQVPAGSTLTLSIDRSGSLVRKLIVMSAGGAVITWDGRDGAGHAVPDATYSWRLTGEDDLGQPMTGPTGGSSLTGTVVVRRSAPAVMLVGPAVNATATAVGGHVPLRWSPKSSLPAGYRVEYDVRYRQLTTDPHGRIQVSNVSPVADHHETMQWTTRTSVLSWQIWSLANPAMTEQYTARSRDNLGHVGTWSPWLSSAVALDDRSAEVSYRGGWSHPRATSAYNGTYSVTTRVGANLYTSGNGRVVYVLGARCRSCGKVRIQLNGGGRTRYITVDTYGSTSTFRRVLAKITVPRADYTVFVTNLGAGSRKRMAVDGFAFRL
ncbi:hypothetical protein [Angustibacter luteus]|uniref:FlgD Ig-like domain-containing protein n=1 Tax=Angustibacter luteus TaxID=658456 RepID=A0ABW1JDK5_9ACTN